jgi:aspartokinase-like uncharacterized kinase
MKDRVPIHVVKIGGSLLQLPELGDGLRDWFDEEGRRFPDAHFVAIVGGGKLVDALRDFDRLHDLGDELAHWLAIDLMEINTRVVRRVWPEAVLVSEWESLNGRLKSPGRTLFAATEFLKGVEPDKPGIRLPASWAVASDSIAGRLAVVLGAERLILLKRWLPKGVGNRVSPPTEGEIPFVDGFFEALRPELPLLELVKIPKEESTTWVEPITAGDR